MDARSEEAKVIAEVDAGFPYQDPEAALQLIKRACAISSNAAFTIPFALATRDSSEPESVLLLLDIWAKLFAHPLKALVLRFAQAMVRREALPLSVTLDAMDVVAKYAGEYQALNVIYFSQKGSGHDAELDPIYDEIHACWT
jgi:hypothetical protein